ncbi:MAG: response regulator transcription factor [Alphaproteobacteria bacterium]|nr:response regulator transcription factor [Alphaproteobacteria bacterium]MCB9693562.1 response regulator transcription factor [Alphaproteobacteria bacterium]
MATILLVEDDGDLADLTRELLEAHGHVVTVDDGGVGADTIRKLSPDVVILDVQLEEGTGYAICKEAREAGYSGFILFLTARVSPMDERVAFELGADDFVRKPVDPDVLLLRIAALLRRRRDEPGTWRNGRLSIDHPRRTVYVDGEEVVLTSGQLELLWLLARNLGRVVGREQYYEEVRGIAYDGVDRSYDNRISDLRSRLAEAGLPGDCIVTVWGEGYLLRPES